MDDKAIFLQALELESLHERTAFLDEACGDDAQLRGQVELLLRSSKEAGDDFLETPAIVGEYDVPEDIEDDMPQTIGRYRVKKVLGEGGFGRVYLAHDDDLDRPVAIKVSHRSRLSSWGDAEAFLAEACIVASLDHPNIVPVYDVGRTDDGLCYIVSKLIEGTDLAHTIKEARPSHAESTELVGTIAEALQYAHEKGLVHRDVKPSNILFDRASKPYIIDFGVALKEEEFGKVAGVAGTPEYMSPEQTRGEGHRVDGRSDVFSLGVVLYELLSGRRPFRGDTQSELLDRIKSAEFRPVRQSDQSIPKELERICLKAMAKRASDRYTTAADFADDLRHCLEARESETFAVHGSTPSALATPTPPSTQTPSQTSVASITPDSGQFPIRIVPKGLRSFNEKDADFFLELLPGPHDRDGLPESIRFWKQRIEETDPDKTFSVGLIYGPSGCGKSSLVKAGLLPRLAGHVEALCIETTANDTEARLLRGLRRICPGLPDNLDLTESLAALRKGREICPGKKILIVLDQFEQWLHAKREEGENELVEGLRQCDGQRVQCIVMVRDDFWMSATRFMRELEIRLVEGHNSAAVDLFDVRHAKRILAALGRAFGALSKDYRLVTADNKAFINQAVAGMSEEGKIVCVRLALFAEMVKGRPWTPATLKEAGGTEGVGGAFLEQTFSATTAPPDHRLHQKAARAVLQALLPEGGTDIRGNMRPREELLEASGYVLRPRDLDDLLRILDNETRLITPTDPQGIETDDQAPSATTVGERYYQLTHDYLVPSLRSWLNRKQQETRRGRAELRLAERAALWNAKPENQHLPSWSEWANIRLLTERNKWTQPQQKMIRRAGLHHGIRAAMLVVFFALMTLAGLHIRDRVVETQNAERAAGLVNALLTADIEQVPRIIGQIDDYRQWADLKLKEAYETAEESSTERLHAGLALLPVDPSQVEYLQGRLLAASPDEVPVLRDALLGHKDKLIDHLWRILENPSNDEQAQTLQTASALASYDPDSERWKGVSSAVTDALVSVNPMLIAKWASFLRPVRASLLPDLAAVYRNRHGKHSKTEQMLATNIFEDYAADRLELMVDLVMDAEPEQFIRLYPVLADHGEKAVALLEDEIRRELKPEGKGPELSISEDEKEMLAKRQANAAIALLRMGHEEKVWPLLKHTPDPRLRSWIINRLASLRADSEAVVNRLIHEPEVSIRRALILSLGEYDDPPLAEHESLTNTLLDMYRDDSDAGIHGAAEWVLRRWGQTEKIQEIDKQLATGEVEGQRQWYVNHQGQTMVVISGPVEFLMGSPDTESGRGPSEQLHPERIGRSFAIAAKEVAVEQFQEFLRQNPSIRHGYKREYAPEPDCPQTEVTWYEAAAYCNWLNEQEDIAQDQWCYLPSGEKFAEEMKLAPDHLGRSGYRLPTEAEWEYGCRALATTSRYYGQSEDLLDKYAWCTHTSRNRSWPVASLKPNDFGLFDMQGNVFEWCQDHILYSYAEPDKAAEDIEDTQPGPPGIAGRVLRSGAFDTPSWVVRSAFRYRTQPMLRNYNTGFRPARTYP